MRTLDTNVIRHQLASMEDVMAEGLGGLPHLVQLNSHFAMGELHVIMDSLRDAFGFETVERGPVAAQLVELAWREVNTAEGYFRQAVDTGRADQFDQGYWGIGRAAEILDDPILN